MSDQKLSTQPYKGTRDFYPEDMRVRSYIFDRVRIILRTFGYDEYDGPMLEPFELYAAKSSEEIVREQLYNFKDRGERELAIRPEMTPTLARMVAGKQNELPKPIRWFSIPNLWRYERPQRGRLREHWQLNVDVFGGGSALAEDLEISQIIVALMSGFGAIGENQYEVRVNHRGLTNYIFKTMLGLSDEKIPVAGRLLDAALKMGKPAFQEALTKEGFSEKQIQLLASLMEKNAAENLKIELVKCPDYKHLTDLFEGLTKLGIAKHFRYDPSIMRGFLYYTGMVLEVYDLHPENNRALFGGGRYDNLVGLFGGKPLPGVGFGMGDVTFRNFLETHKLLPDLQSPSGIYIAHLGEAQFLDAQKLAADLRQALKPASREVAIITALEASSKPNKHFERAEKLHAKAIIFVGEQEVASKTYTLKNLALRETVVGDVQSIAQKYLDDWN